jgi:hypothetical protein
MLQKRTRVGGEGFIAFDLEIPEINITCILLSCVVQLGLAGGLHILNLCIEIDKEYSARVATANRQNKV